MYSHGQKFANTLFFINNNLSKNLHTTVNFLYCLIKISILQFLHLYLIYSNNSTGYMYTEIFIYLSKDGLH